MIRLKNLRESAKLTQKELADKLGISPSNVSKYEMGTLEPNIEILKTYAKNFDVSIDFILGLTSQPNRENFSDETSFLYLIGENGISRKINIPEKEKSRLKKLLEAGLPEIFDK